MQLTKTDFIHYLNCSKSLWLEKHKPEIYPYGEFSEFMKKLTEEGYEVEQYVRQLIDTFDDFTDYVFQRSFLSARGLFAKADIIRSNEDGSVNLYEIKSSTSVKSSGKHNQIKDAAFQKIAAQEAGYNVRRVFIIHLNKDYVSDGIIDPEELLVFADVTEDVAEIEAETNYEIEQALELLNSAQIDETSCSCLYLTKGNHCDAFDYFNPNLPSPSIYNLPRISRAKLTNFVLDSRFDLDEIDESEVTEKQALVLKSAHAKTALIDIGAIAQFYDGLEYPLYFFDYETYSSAIPITSGSKPQHPLPFQYSLHIKKGPDDTNLTHVEYLSEEAKSPFQMIEHMENHFGDRGHLVSWHAAFENTQNRNMAAQFHSKSDFLYGLIERTVDLEDLFKEAYVDIAFQGSTSIKKVLPVVVPELSYDGMKVANGTDAMESWKRLIRMRPSQEKAKLKAAMLDYCKLDTLAMVKIFDAVRKILN